MSWNEAALAGGAGAASARILRSRVNCTAGSSHGERALYGSGKEGPPMPADNLAWLIDHFSRFNGGSDPILAARFLQSLRKEAERLGMFPAELLSLVERHAERGIVDVPEAVRMRDSRADT